MSLEKQKHSNHTTKRTDLPYPKHTIRKEPFAIECELRWRVMGGKRVMLSGSGRTLKMSSSEVYFKADRALESGEIVELSVDWPVLLNDSCPLKLVISGPVTGQKDDAHVLRIDRHEFKTRGRR